MPDLPDFYAVVIIGGGPAGLAAALYAARGLHRTLIIEKAAPGGKINQTDRVDDYPGHYEGTPGPVLGKAMWDQAAKFGAETVIAEVTGLEPHGGVKTVHTTKGDYQARTVILAAGGEPRRLGIPGEAALLGKGVFVGRVEDPAALSGKAVAVIGGGDSALTEALRLAEHGAQVTVVHRGSDLRAIEVVQAAAHGNGNIAFLLNTVAEAVLGEGGVTGLRVRNLSANATEMLDVAAVSVKVGFAPNTALLDGLVALDTEGRITTDEWLTTAAPGVFVAGDVRADAAQLVIAAGGDGATAAIAADHYLSNPE